MLKEYEYSLNTEEGNVSTIDTGKIKGCLKNILLSTDKAVRVTISLAEHPSIHLLKLDNFSGEDIITIRDKVTTAFGETFNYQSAEYVLNDSLLITISAARETKTIVKIRVDE